VNVFIETREIFAPCPGSSVSGPDWFHCGSGSCIIGQIQGFDDQKLKKIYSRNFWYFCDQKFQLKYTFIKDVLDTGEGFSPHEYLALQNLKFLPEMLALTNNVPERFYLNVFTCVLECES
jgi:hypothetical protein